MKGTNAELTFENLDFNNYYPVSAPNYDGYQGFDFADMGLLTADAIQFLGYGDFTGYSSVLSGSTTCAFTYINRFGHGGGSGLGELLSSDKHETFNLQNGTFASAWDSKQPTYFEALDRNGHVTATVYVALSQAPLTIDFTAYGSEFQHISGLKIVSEKGTPGKYGLTGYQIAMDNIYVHWNGKIPYEARSHGPAIHHASPFVSEQHGGWFNHSDWRDMAGPSGQDHDFQGVTSLPGVNQSDGAGAHSGLSLPPVDHHFGP